MYTTIVNFFQIKIKVFCVILVSIFFSLDALSYEQQRALDNWAEEISACASYYAIVIHYSNVNAEQQHSEKWGQVAKNYAPTLNNSLALLHVAMSGQPEAYVQSKLDLRQQEQIKIINTEGIDRLMGLYKDSCKDLLEHSDWHLQYWLDKK